MLLDITIFILKLLDDMLFAAIPAVGFALVFNVPPKALKYCAILAALGHVTRTLLLHINMPIVFATFFATCVIGFFRRASFPSLFSPSQSLHRCRNYPHDPRCSCL